MHNKVALIKIQMINKYNYYINGGIIMSKIIVDEQEILNQSRIDKQKIINKIKNMDNFLKIKDMPEKNEFENDLQYLNTVKTPQNQINERAEKELRTFRDSSLKTINQNFDKNLIKNKSDIQKTESESYDKEKNILNDSEILKNKAREKAVGKGLGRSSILGEEIRSIGETAERELQDVKTQATINLEKLQEQSEALIKDRDDALQNFEIEYAIKLQNKIDGYANEIAEYNNKIIKYNNELKDLEDKKRQKYQNDYIKQVENAENQNREIIKFLDKYGYGSVSALLQKQKEDTLKEYLNTLSKENALKVLLEDNSFQELIGRSSFEKLLQSVKERLD